MTGSPGGHEAVWPSAPMPRWITSKRSGRVDGVVGGGCVEVGGGDRHQVHACRARRSAGRRCGPGRRPGRPLVDLPDPDRVPRAGRPRPARRAGAARSSRRRRPAWRGPVRRRRRRGGGRSPRRRAPGHRRRRSRSGAACADHAPPWALTRFVRAYSTGTPSPMTTAVRTDGARIARQWRDPLARAGIAARGVLYLVLGLLAIQFARGDVGSDAGQPGRGVREGRRAAARQVPARRPHRRAGGDDVVAADPGVRR